MIGPPTQIPVISINSSGRIRLAESRNLLLHASLLLPKLLSTEFLRSYFSDFQKMAENQTEVPETETIDMKEELTKLEDEINTLKQVFNATIS